MYPKSMCASKIKIYNQPMSMKKTLTGLNIVYIALLREVRNSYLYKHLYAVSPLNFTLKVTSFSTIKVSKGL